MIIPGFDRYDISKDGIVTNLKTGKEVKQVITTSGNMKYKRVSLVDNNGKVRMHNVMKLLAETYLIKPQAKVVVRAKDGNNLNTVLSNVEYVTRQSIVAQAWSDGKMARRRSRPKSWNEDTLDYVYNTLDVLGTATLTRLNEELALPFSTIRYAVQELVNRNRVVRTKEGFEVIPI